MPPKKKEVVEEKPILGRFSSHLKIGARAPRRTRSRCAALRHIAHHTHRSPPRAAAARARLSGRATWCTARAC
jgi:hypothetical protein